MTGPRRSARSKTETAREFALAPIIEGGEGNDSGTERDAETRAAAETDGGLEADPGAEPAAPEGSGEGGIAAAHESETVGRDPLGDEDDPPIRPYPDTDNVPLIAMRTLLEQSGVKGDPWTIQDDARDAVFASIAELETYTQRALLRVSEKIARSRESVSAAFDDIEDCLECLHQFDPPVASLASMDARAKELMRTAELRGRTARAPCADAGSAGAARPWSWERGPLTRPQAIGTGVLFVVALAVVSMVINVTVFAEAPFFVDPVTMYSTYAPRDAVAWEVHHDLKAMTLDAAAAKATNWFVTPFGKRCLVPAALERGATCAAHHGAAVRVARHGHNCTVLTITCREIK